MNQDKAVRRGDKAAARLARKIRDDPLDVGIAANSSHDRLDRKRLGRRFERPQKIGSTTGSGVGVEHDRRPFDARRNLLEQLQPLAAHEASVMKPVTLPPGRDRLATRPSLTGSDTIANTIGMVRSPGAGPKSPAWCWQGSRRVAARPAPSRKCASARHRRPPSDIRCAHCARRSIPFFEAANECRDEGSRGGVAIGVAH